MKETLRNICVTLLFAVGFGNFFGSDIKEFLFLQNSTDLQKEVIDKKGYVDLQQSPNSRFLKIIEIGSLDHPDAVYFWYGLHSQKIRSGIMFCNTEKHGNYFTLMKHISYLPKRFKDAGYSIEDFTNLSDEELHTAYVLNPQR